MSNDNNDYFNAFEGLMFPKAPKRRSSILKSVDVNYVSEERFKTEDRRGSRRVSWAQTFQYKELHPDGTTVIMSQELKNKSEDNHTSHCTESEAVSEMNSSKDEPNMSEMSVSVDQNKIIATDFINKLKNLNNSKTETNETISHFRRKRRHRKSKDRNENQSPKHKLQKSTNESNVFEFTKRFTNEDMEITFNKSEIAVSENKADDDSQQLSEISDNSALHTIHDTTMMSIENSLLTENKSQDNDTSLCIQSKAVSEMNNSKDEPNMSEMSVSVDQNKIISTDFINKLKNLNNSKTETIETITSIRQSMHRKSEDHNENQSLKHKRQKSTNESNAFEFTKQFTNEDMEMTCNMFKTAVSEIEANDGSQQCSDVFNNYALHTIHNTTLMSIENSLLTENKSEDNQTSLCIESEAVSEINNSKDDQNMSEMSISVDQNKIIATNFINKLNILNNSKNESIERMASIRQSMHRKSEDHNENQSSKHKRQKSTNECNVWEFTKQFTNEDMEMTCNKSKITVSEIRANDDSQQLSEVSDNSTLHTIHDTTMMTTDISVEMSIENSLQTENKTEIPLQMTTEIIRIDEPKRRSQPLIRKNVLPSIKLPNMSFSIINSEQSKRLSSTKLNMGWLAVALNNNNDSILSKRKSQVLSRVSESEKLNKSKPQVLSRISESEELNKSKPQILSRVSESEELNKYKPQILSQDLVSEELNKSEQQVLSWDSQSEKLNKSKPQVLSRVSQSEELNKSKSQVLSRDSQSEELNKSEQQLLSRISESEELNKSKPQVLSRDSQSEELNKSKPQVLSRDSQSEELNKSKPQVLSRDSQSEELNKSKPQVLSRDSQSEELNKSEQQLLSRDSESEELIISQSEVLSSNDSILSKSKSQVLSRDSESLEFRSFSPLSQTMAESPVSCSYLISSPQSVDMTLNFSTNPPESPSDDFNPFIHTNQSFHANSSFYNSTSPLQLSFMLKDDTLCILSDQLEEQMNDIVIPAEEPQELMTTTIETYDVLTPLRKVDAQQNGFQLEIVNEEKLLISYLWASFALEIRFGKTLENSLTKYPIREILSINMKSLISAEEPLRLRQQELILQFNECHKPLLMIAHDLIISSFENEKSRILNKYQSSATLDELVSEISIKVLSARNLLTELRIISSTQICKLFPKQNNSYSLVVEILGLRNPIHLILPLNPKSYPDEVIHPKFKIHDEDQHLYCLNELSAALLMIDSRKFDYIRRLIKATKMFVRAKKRVITDRQRNLRQKQEIENAKLLFS